MTESIRVLIVDANPARRRALSGLVNSLPDAEVAVAVSGGKQAIGMLGFHEVDLILIDFDTPDMDGVEVLERIREAHPDLSAAMMIDESGADGREFVEAPGMGSLERLPKLAPGDENSVRDFRLSLLTIMGQARNRKNLRVARALMRKGPAAAAGPPADRGKNRTRVKSGRRPGAGRSAPAPPPGKIDVVAMGISTGGPDILAEIIPKLPGDLGAPVLLVQHMPSDLTGSLARSLNAKSSLHVREAADNEEVLPNVVYLAPGGKHMVVRNKSAENESFGSRYIGLNDDPPINSIRPAADVLFRSVAQVYRGAILAVVMTGMGSDGVKGVAAMKKKGCYCLTQSEDSCVVYGMPRAVVEAGLSDETAHPEKIADRITFLVKGKSGEKGI
ncbi:MAG: response regulator [Desulfobacterales bacterium]|nr:response regulator [Desulfobacterales bacterium]